MHFFIRLLSIKNSLDNNLFNVNNKKLTEQCAPYPSASIMTLKKGIAITMEGRHLVLTLLATVTILCNYSADQLLVTLVKVAERAN